MTNKGEIAMKSNLTIMSMFDGSEYGEIVTGIASRLDSEISNLSKAILQKKDYSLPGYSDVRIQNEVSILWEDKLLNLPKFLASPKLKRLLIADTYTRLVDAAYSATAFYEMFSPASQDILVQFLEYIEGYEGKFSAKVQTVLDKLDPKAFRSEYAYVLSYSLMLILLPIFGSSSFKPLGRLGGLHSESVSIISQPYFRSFIKLISSKLSGDIGRQLEYIFGYLSLGVVSDLEISLENTLERFALKANENHDDILTLVLREYPNDAIILVASKICPLLFAENLFTRLHILCRLSWTPMDIYPDRVIRFWLPFGYMDLLKDADAIDKVVNDVLNLPRLSEIHKFEQICEVLKTSDIVNTLELTPAVTELLKYQVYSAILLPLLRNLAYNKVAMHILQEDINARITLGALLYDSFRDICLSRDHIRESLMDGDVTSLELSKSKDTVTRLLDVREKFLSETILKE